MALAPSFLMTLDCHRVLVVAGEHLVLAVRSKAAGVPWLVGRARRVPTGSRPPRAASSPWNLTMRPGRNVASSRDDSNDPVETASPGEIFPCLAVRSRGPDLAQLPQFEGVR